MQPLLYCQNPSLVGPGDVSQRFNWTDHDMLNRSPYQQKPASLFAMMHVRLQHFLGVLEPEVGDTRRAAADFPRHTKTY